MPVPLLLEAEVGAASVRHLQHVPHADHVVAGHGADDRVGARLGNDERESLRLTLIDARYRIGRAGAAEGWWYVARAHAVGVCRDDGAVWQRTSVAKDDIDAVAGGNG